MNPVKRRLVLAGIISLSLVAAACGSDDKSADSTTAPAATDGAPPRTAADDADTAATATEARGTHDRSGGGTRDGRLLQAVRQPGRQRRDVPEGLLRRRHRHARRHRPRPHGRVRRRRFRQGPQRPAGDGRRLRRHRRRRQGRGHGRSTRAASSSTCPTVIAPITMSYNLPSVDKLQLSPTSIAGDLPTRDHEVERPDDRCRQPRRHAARHRHRRGPPGRRLWHHGELLQVPRRGCRTRRRWHVEAGRQPRSSSGPTARRPATATAAWPRSCRPPKAPSATSTSAMPRPTT